MYNIDFKVGSSIVTLQVYKNDSFQNSITRMQTLKPFKQISKSKLQQKLKICINKVLKDQNIDTKIKSKLKDLIKNIQQIQNPICVQNTVKKIENLSNNTFVNILQESSINQSNILNLTASQQILKRNYLLNSNKTNNEEYFTNNLKFNYQNKKEQKVSNKKPFVYLNDQNRKQRRNSCIDNIVAPKQNSFQYLQNQNKNIQSFQSMKKNCRQVQSLKKKYDYQSMNKELCQNKKIYKDQVVQTNKSYLRNQGQNNLFQIKRNYGTLNLDDFPSKYERNTSNLHLKKKPYDPVPKLNQLIERSRSLSHIVQKDYNFDIRHQEPQLNDNIQNFKYTFKPFSNHRAPIQNHFQSYESTVAQKRSKVGKIHHRQNQIKTKYSYL